MMGTLPLTIFYKVGDGLRSHFEVSGAIPVNLYDIDEHADQTA